MKSPVFTPTASVNASRGTKPTVNGNGGQRDGNAQAQMQATVAPNQGGGLDHSSQLGQLLKLFTECLDAIQSKEELASNEFLEDLVAQLKSSSTQVQQRIADGNLSETLLVAMLEQNDHINRALTRFETMKVQGPARAANSGQSAIAVTASTLRNDSAVFGGKSFAEEEPVEGYGKLQASQSSQFSNIEADLLDFSSGFGAGTTAQTAPNAIDSNGDILSQ